VPSRTDRTYWSFACSSARFDRIALGWATGPPTVYVRLGSTNRETDPQLINQLQREAESASFDESPVVHLSATDVDLDHVMHFI
jgi:predicted HTH transcriptional regulator